MTAFDDLTNEFNVLKADLDAAAAYVNGLVSSNVALTTQVGLLTTQVGQLQSQLAAANQTIANLQAQLATHTKTLWGSSVWVYQGETYAQALARTEKSLGTLGVVRYYAGAPVWPANTGTRPLVISFKWQPSDVLAGTHDAEFKTWCAAAPDRVTYWSYWHEPENDGLNLADYRAAWVRLAGIAKASGKNLKATLILMSYDLDPNSHRNWKDYYAGDSVIDVLAWDAYNPLNGANPDAAYGPCLAVNKQIGKPWGVAETGVSSKFYSATQRYAMLTQMSAWLAKANPAPEFVTYFDSDPSGSGTWVVSKDPQAGPAWVAGINS